MNAAACNICGGTNFGAGPGGRLSVTGVQPYCIACGSLERHRAIRAVFQKLHDDRFKSAKVLQFSRDPSIMSDWVASHEVSTYGGDNSLDLMRIDRPSECYDIVICNHVLEHVQYDNSAMNELARVAKKDGFVFLSFPDPVRMTTTVEWDQPRSDQHDHWRVYGRDVEDRFRRYIPHVHILAHEEPDPVSGAPDIVYFLCHSESAVERIRAALGNPVYVNKPQSPVVGAGEGRSVQAADPKIEKRFRLLERLSLGEAAYKSPIHPKDNMHSVGRTEPYYDVGRDALWNIVQSMLAANLTDARRFLDFPSGFGRVTRFIRAAFPDADIDVGDIWDEAVESCAATYRARKIEVQGDLRTIVSGQYDVIFCGSLLTHFNEAKSNELLDFFASRLTVGGVMIVTCSGRKNLAHEATSFNKAVFETRENLERLTKTYRDGAFAYVDYPGQSGYGRSFTPVSWFHSWVVDKPDFAIVRFAERGWDDNQDVITFKRMQ